jgi:rod shape-determining protein MreC
MSDASERSLTRRRNLVFVLALGASLLTLLISTNSLAGVPQRVGLSVLSFFQKGFDAVGNFASDTLASVSELRDMKKRYRDLMDRVEQYQNLERNLSSLEAENERLRGQLEYSNKSTFRKTSARIIAKDPGNLYSSFVIDKGLVDGLRKNLPVVAYQDGTEGLVGKILEVGRSSSIVSPIFDSSMYIGARLDRTRYEGLVSGGGSSDVPLTMKYVKKRAKDEIQFGDLVVTTGYQSLYPKDVIIGRVSKILITDYQTSLDIDVEPVLDFGRLEYVFVIFHEEQAEE